jgi:hypothetical protein
LAVILINFAVVICIMVEMFTLGSIQQNIDAFARRQIAKFAYAALATALMVSLVLRAPNEDETKRALIWEAPVSLYA